jgi:hypothetical protein
LHQQVEKDLAKASVVDQELGVQLNVSRLFADLRERIVELNHQNASLASELEATSRSIGQNVLHSAESVSQVSQEGETIRALMVENVYQAEASGVEMLKSEIDRYRL